MHKSLLALLFGVVLSLLTAEATLRLVAPQEASWLDIYRREPGDPYYSLQPELRKRIETGETTWKVYTDSKGRRVGRSPRPTPLREPVLYVLGDSFSFGHGVDYEASFVGQLAERLDGSAAVVNLAVPGYGPVQYRQVLEAAIENGERPAVLLLALFLGNDFYDCVWGKDVVVIDGAVATSENRLRAGLKRNLHLYRLLSKVFQRLSPVALARRRVPTPLFLETAWRDGELRRAHDILRSELAAIAALAAGIHTPLVVGAIPAPESIAAAGVPPTGVALRPELPMLKALEVLGELGVTAIDLTPALRALGTTHAFFQHDGHLTPEGNKAVADALWPMLHAALAGEAGSDGPRRRATPRSSRCAPAGHARAGDRRRARRPSRRPRRAGRSAAPRRLRS